MRSAPFNNNGCPVAVFKLDNVLGMFVANDYQHRLRFVYVRVCVCAYLFGCIIACVRICALSFVFGTVVCISHVHTKAQGQCRIYTPFARKPRLTVYRPHPGSLPPRRYHAKQIQEYLLDFIMEIQNVKNRTTNC